MKLYSDIASKETYIELWGGSTKHPDCVYKLSDYINNQIAETYRNAYETAEIGLILQWVLYVASTMLMPYSSYKIAKFAMDYWDKY